MEFICTENRALQESLIKAQRALKETRVEIGLPDSASERNHFLLALHERGAPIAHIPPRPVIRPALGREKTREGIAAGLISACEAAKAGDEKGVGVGFEQAGQAGVEGIREYIDEGIKPGNAHLTIHGGWIRNFASGKPVYVEGKGFDKPMYDTGELYDAFDYEVKSGG